MKISVVMASFLGPYANAAKWRERKIIRAIDSFLNQTHPDKELIIVADGCDKTCEIVGRHYSEYPSIKLMYVDKQPIWSGLVRTTGIKAATGQYITYLDNDDYIGANHLSIIAAGLDGKALDWAWFCDYILSDYINPALSNNQLVKGKCGTCNIVHRQSIDELWNVKADYEHDWNAIKYLMKHHKNYQAIETAEYYICHLPQILDI